MIVVADATRTHEAEKVSEPPPARAPACDMLAPESIN